MWPGSSRRELQAVAGSEATLVAVNGVMYLCRAETGSWRWSRKAAGRSEVIQLWKPKPRAAAWPVGREMPMILARDFHPGLQDDCAEAKKPAWPVRNAGTRAKALVLHSVLQPGEAGHESWDGTGGATDGCSTGASMLWMPRGTFVYDVWQPPSDYCGFDSKGNDLFGKAVEALDAGNPNTIRITAIFPRNPSR
jgi:hypothetical protein